MLAGKYHIQLSQDQFIFLFAVFVLISAALVSWGRKGWKKLVAAFPTSIKANWNEKAHSIIQINAQKYRAVVRVLENGLAISQYGLAPKLFLPGQALIPWSACSSIDKKDINAFGMSFTQYSITVNAKGEKLSLTLQSDIGSTILEKGYLKIS